MKIDLLSFQGAAVLAVMFAAIILSQVFAPGVVGIITSTVSTLVGALFLERKPKAEDKQ
jgi:hypothetical protein